MTEPSDIVAFIAELKDVRPMPWDDDIADACEKAAALIERQAAEIERLRGALLPFTCQGVDLDHVGSVYVAQSDVIAARAALSGKAAS